jgi:hypothetical protein
MTSSSASDHGNPSGIAALMQKGTTSKGMEANKNFAKWLSCGIQISGTFGLHHVVCFEYVNSDSFYYYLTGASSSPQRSLKFRIKKPWTACLGENKKSWKEQAARGRLSPLQFLYCITSNFPFPGNRAT